MKSFFFFFFTHLPPVILTSFLFFKHAELIPISWPFLLLPLLSMLCHRFSYDPLLHFIQALYKCNLLREAYPITLSKIASLVTLCFYLLYFLSILLFLTLLYIYLFNCLLSFFLYYNIALLGQGLCHVPQQLKYFVLYCRWLINICWMNGIIEWCDEVSLKYLRGDV